MLVQPHNCNIKKAAPHERVSFWSQHTSSSSSRAVRAVKAGCLLLGYATADGSEMFAIATTEDSH